MADLTEYISDTTLLEQMIKSLKDLFNVNVSVMDSNRKIIPIGDTDNKELETKRFYPFEFTENIGGLMCYAKNENAINNADGQLQIYMLAINTLLQREIEIQQMSDEIIELSEQINFLFLLAKDLSGIKELHVICKLIVDKISNKISADCGFISMKDVKGKSVTTTYNISEKDVIKMQDEEAFATSYKKLKTVLSTISNGMSVIVLPLNTKDTVFGFMAFFRNKDRRFFTAYEKKFVSIINNTVLYIIETIRLYDNLNDVYFNTIRSLASAVDAKDQYTHGHSSRVAKYSVAVAKKMDLPEADISKIEIAAYLHDLGKIGVPDAVLKKEGKLTDEEYNEIKKHPFYTDKILGPMHLPNFIVDAATQHHEKLGGDGYPFGLSGNEICIGARVIAVADVFDALTSKRTYRDKMTVEKALQILREDINNHFDKNAVLSLINVISDDIETSEISDIYHELKFSDLQHLNKFLVNLTKHLIEDDLR